MELITSNETTLAIIVRGDFKSDSIDFVTPDSNELQVGYMSRPEGHVIRAHKHLPTHRVLNSTQEVLIIREGKVRVDFYAPEAEYLKSEILQKGDLIVLIGGGHGFKVLEPLDMVEVKQGPYVMTQDKGFIDTVPDEDVRFGGCAR